MQNSVMLLLAVMQFLVYPQQDIFTWTAYWTEKRLSYTSLWQVPKALYLNASG